MCNRPWLNLPTSLVPGCISSSWFPLIILTWLVTLLVLLRQRAARTTAMFVLCRLWMIRYTLWCRRMLMLVAGLLRNSIPGWRDNVPVTSMCCPTLLDSLCASELCPLYSVSDCSRSLRQVLLGFLLQRLCANWMSVVIALKGLSVTLRGIRLTRWCVVC